MLPKTAKATKNKQKQTSQKNSIIYDNIKKVQIHYWEIQFYQNGSIRLSLLEFEIHGNGKFEQKMISLEEILDQDREFTHVLNKQKCVLFFAPFVW